MVKNIYEIATDNKLVFREKTKNSIDLSVLNTDREEYNNAK